MKKRALLFSVVFFGFALLPMSAFADHDVKAKHSCVTFYEHINYGGKSITYCSDVRNVGRAWNDTFSSARVSSGKGVVVYEHIDFSGDSWKLRPGNYPNFTHNGWNDKISSVDIR